MRIKSLPIVMIGAARYRGVMGWNMSYWSAFEERKESGLYYQNRHETVN